MDIKHWVVYLIQCSDNSLYCGITNNLKKRLAAHNSGRGAKYTRFRRPFELVGASSQMTKGDALKLEYRIKQVPAHKKIIELVKGKGETKMDIKYVDRLFEIIKNMSGDEQKKLFEDLEKRQINKLRKNERMECLITVNYAAKGRAYQNYIQDISTEGVFIETRAKFSVSDEILLTISYSNEVRPFKIAGEVVRISSKGVGVKFKKLSQVQGEIIKTIIKKTGEPKKKSKLGK